ncbi:MAG TPA: hypothetical protein PLV65_09005, partial [Tenuifilaceae bacterium]|nr:hypothetical protein [Tenuifilaceae bacterium]
MKKLYILLTAILIASSLFAQVPQKMSYQAVVRNADNSLVTNTSIGMQVSILQGSTDGTAVYVERHTTSTNANGLVTIEVGTGTVVSGNFASIDWANGPYYFKTESDPAGGTSYTISGTSQLLSVPYALHAQTANELSGGVTETDPVFTAWDKSSGILISVNQVTDLENYADTLSQHFNFESVQNGDLLMYNGTQWVKFTPSYLTSFTESDPTVAANFSFAGAATGDLLQFDGTKWVKLTPTYLSSYTETDPVFAEWDKSSGISVTESQISDLKSYLTAITGESIGDLNDVDLTGIGADKILKYNAAAQKWIIAEAAGTTETDPIFSAWDKSSGITVTENQISDLGSYLETEADPAFSGNFSIANPNAGEVLRYDGTHFVN